MNELKISGKQEFMGIEIPIIEGGFGNDCRIVTFDGISRIHNIQVKDINKAISRLIAKGRFSKSIEYIDLFSSEDFKVTARNLGLLKSNGQKSCYVLSERGYIKLIKYMDDDTSWDVMDNFVDEYFDMREIINSDEQLKSKYLLSIYNGGQEAVIASKELSKLEVKEATIPLLETIEEQKPKAEFHDTVHTSVNSISVGKFSGVLQKNTIFKKFGRNKFFQWLRDNDYLCTCGDLKNKPTQKALSAGYMDYDEYVADNGYGKSITTYKPLITGKGQTYFTKKLLDEFK